MGAVTSIAWCHHTFNPWWGCAKVSPGCANCYAEAIDARWGAPHWGVKAPRRFFGDKHWAEPLRWNEAARRAGERRRVFCASMADVFEDAPGLEEQRKRLWRLIYDTKNLDWLLLTKRPENVLRCWNMWAIMGPPSNVWLGTSVEDQERADERIPELLKAPARVRFLSVEPLLGLVDLMQLEPAGKPIIDCLHGMSGWGCAADECGAVDLVIVGGESGPRARPCDVAWVRAIVAQCRAAGVACFVKQLGARPVQMVPRAKMPVVVQGLLSACGFEPATDVVREMEVACARIDLRDSKGADPAEWPEDLRVQEMPT